MIALRKPEEPRVEDEARPFLAFVSDEATAAIVRDAVTQADLSGDDIIVGSLDDAIDGLANVRTPALLIVDLGASPNVMVEAERLAQVCDPDADVVLLGAVNDMMLQRELVAAGVADYIVKPFVAADLARTVRRLQAPAPAPEQTVHVQPKPDDMTCQGIAVVGVRGGVGASTIAANLAWSLSHDLGHKTTLLDLDLTFGTQALLMDIDPGNGLADAMLEPGRMDELFVKRASTTIDEKLSVIAAETDTQRGDIASDEAIDGLFAFLAADNAYVVADIPRSLAVAQPRVLKRFARIILVAEPTLASVRDTARMATHIGLNAPEAVIGIVLARCGFAKSEELSQKAFEQGANVKVAATLPYDPRTAMSAEAAGKCVTSVAKRSKLGRAMIDAVPTLCGQELGAKRAGLGALLKGIKKPKGDAEASDVR